MNKSEFQRHCFKCHRTFAKDVDFNQECKESSRVYKDDTNHRVWVKIDHFRRTIVENYINEHKDDHFVDIVDNIVLFDPTCKLDLPGLGEKVDLKH